MRAAAVAVVLWTACAGSAIAAAGDRCEIRELHPGSQDVVLRDADIDVLLHGIAPRSKSFHTDHGMLIFEENGLWYFVNGAQDVVVQIFSRSTRWQAFLEEILPQRRDRFGYLDTEIRRRLLAEETCALAGLISRLNEMFCFYDAGDFAERLAELRLLQSSREDSARPSESGESTPGGPNPDDARGDGVSIEEDDIVLYAWTSIELPEQMQLEDPEARPYYVLVFVDARGGAPPPSDCGRCAGGGGRREDPPGDRGRPGPPATPRDLSTTPPQRSPSPSPEPEPERAPRVDEAEPEPEPESLVEPEPEVEPDEGVLADEDTYFLKQTCPGDLRTAVESGDLLSHKSLAFLIDDTEDSGLGDWILIGDHGQDTYCYKCGSLAERDWAFIVASDMDAPIIIGEWDHVAGELDAETVRLFDSAIRWFRDGTLRSADLHYAGTGGFVYEIEGVGPALLTPSLLVECSVLTRQQLSALESWHQFMRYPRTSTDPSVDAIFRLLARSRDEWKLHYRQDPLGLIRNLCSLIEHEE